jgi:hypothetical protein
LSKKAGKILICSANPNALAMEVYNLVLVQPLLELENGDWKCYSCNLKKQVQLFGTLHAVLGYDVALRKIQVFYIS